MSTRANIIIKDDYSTLWFYRHSDGYPEGTMPTLEKFLGWVKEGKIRDNTGQAAGWLIMIGADEYREHTDYTDGKYTSRDKTEKELLEPMDDGMRGWKVGAYEPTEGQHEDIKYLYTIDLKAKTIDIKEI